MTRTLIKRLSIFAMLLVTIAIIASLTACGGGAISTVTVTASGQSGGATSTVTVTSAGNTGQVVAYDPSKLPKDSSGTIQWHNYYPSIAGSKVTVVLTNITHSFQILGKNQCEQINKDQNLGIQFTWSDSQQNMDNMQQLVKSAIDSKTNCIVMDPIDPIAFSPLVLQAQKAGIPVVIWRYYTAQKPDVDVSDNLYGMGMLAADFFASKLGGQGNVAEIYGDNGSFASDGRHAGFAAGIAKYPGMKIEAISHPDDLWSHKGGYDSAVALLAKYPDIKAIFCHNDEEAGGAGTALRTEGRAPNVLLVGTDGDFPALTDVKNGGHDGSVMIGQGPEFGDLVMAAIEEVLQPGYVAGSQSLIFQIPLYLATKDNINTVIWPPNV